VKYSEAFERLADRHYDVIDFILLQKTRFGVGAGIGRGELVMARHRRPAARACISLFGEAGPARSIDQLSANRPRDLLGFLAALVRIAL
jgi:hypothetical protein